MQIGVLKGVLGLQTQNTKFSALGEEAFLPEVETQSLSAFVYEELDLQPLILSVGVRSENVGHTSKGGGPEDVSVPGNARFGSDQTLNFQPKSVSSGILYNFTKGFNASLNVSLAQRAPTYNELFANGPHVATGQYEVGDPSLSVERARQTELNLRWKNRKSTGSIGAFYVSGS